MSPAGEQQRQSHAPIETYNLGARSIVRPLANMEMSVVHALDMGLPGPCNPSHTRHARCCIWSGWPAITFAHADHRNLFRPCQNLPQWEDAPLQRRTTATISFDKK